ncbi:hypothetical protein DLAC_10491 [Tieghemostelium lacteum]|uniref:Major capsid protein N-terminal domain-containing protein n=1 Tax=Tieghemostelium lacteum TaxID=361077 RepID=A0A151Z4L4_TIELA|nr:hypothetical protein DLAC_10491 [Tieghemostelium lacteum]|eukprot:KYQ88909.1 hypothetical protein DLAC_10491 [Tieghemostelium lacteum]
MEQVVSKELDYRPLLVSEPEYEFTRLFPQSGSTQTTVTAGGNDTIFEIPPSKAYNFGKSWFQFQFQLPATATNFGVAFADFTPFFRQIQVYTRGGLYLMDHTNFHLHSKMVTKINKKIIETLNSYNSAPGTASQSYLPCYSSNTLASANPRYQNTTAGNPNSVVSLADRNYTEPTYLIVGSAINTTTNLFVTIPFSELYESILAVDKDIMLNETLLVRFVWSELSNIGFGAPVGLTPGGSGLNPPTQVPVPLAGPVTPNVTNMEIHLAIEKNLAIVNNLQQKISSAEGFSLMIPYCYQNQASLTGTNQSVTLRINRQNGMTLERIYHSIFIPGGGLIPGGTTTSYNTAIYNNNIASSNLDHFYTNLNNNKLMQYDYYTPQSAQPGLDDYKALRPILLNSTVQSPNIHYYNWCWVEEFGDGTFDYNPDNVVTGIDLNLGEQKWDFVGFIGVSANLIHQSTVVCKRKLVITANGLVLV